MIRWNLLGACLLTALLAVSAGANELDGAAAEDAPSSDTNTASAAAEAPSHDASGSALQALTVRPDPETGALGAPGHAPLAEKSQLLADEMRRMLSEKMAGVPAAYRIPWKSSAVERTDGSRMVQLGLEHLSFAVVRVAEDGTLVHDCTESEGAAPALLARPAHTHGATEDR